MDAQKALNFVQNYPQVASLRPFVVSGADGTPPPTIEGVHIADLKKALQFARDRMGDRWGADMAAGARAAVTLGVQRLHAALCALSPTAPACKHELLALVQQMEGVGGHSSLQDWSQQWQLKAKIDSLHSAVYVPRIDLRGEADRFEFEDLVMDSRGELRLPATLEAAVRAGLHGGDLATGLDLVCWAHKRGWTQVMGALVDAACATLASAEGAAWLKSTPRDGLPDLFAAICAHGSTEQAVRLLADLDQRGAPAEALRPLAVKLSTEGLADKTAALCASIPAARGAVAKVQRQLAARAAAGRPEDPPAAGWPLPEELVADWPCHCTVCAPIVGLMRSASLGGFIRYTDKGVLIKHVGEQAFGPFSSAGVAEAPAAVAGHYTSQMAAWLQRQPHAHDYFGYRELSFKLTEGRGKNKRTVQVAGVQCLKKTEWVHKSRTSWGAAKREAKQLAQLLQRVPAAAPVPAPAMDVPAASLASPVRSGAAVRGAEAAAAPGGAASAATAAPQITQTACGMAAPAGQPGAEARVQVTPAQEPAMRAAHEVQPSGGVTAAAPAVPAAGDVVAAESTAQALRAMEGMPGAAGVPLEGAVGGAAAEDVVMAAQQAEQEAGQEEAMQEAEVEAGEHEAEQEAEHEAANLGAAGPATAEDEAADVQAAAAAAAAPSSTLLRAVRPERAVLGVGAAAAPPAAAAMLEGDVAVAAGPVGGEGATEEDMQVEGAATAPALAAQLLEAEPAEVEEVPGQPAPRQVAQRAAQVTLSPELAARPMVIAATGHTQRGSQQTPATQRTPSSTGRRRRASFPAASGAAGTPASGAGGSAVGKRAAAGGSTAKRRDTGPGSRTRAALAKTAQKLNLPTLAYLWGRFRNDPARLQLDFSEGGEAEGGDAEGDAEGGDGGGGTGALAHAFERAAGEVEPGAAGPSSKRSRR